jgi:hypothetical protein
VFLIWMPGCKKIESQQTLMAQQITFQPISSGWETFSSNNFHNSSLPIWSGDFWVV